MQDKTKIFNKALQLQMKGKFSEAQKFYLKLINEKRIRTKINVMIKLHFLFDVVLIIFQLLMVTYLKS